MQMPCLIWYNADRAFLLENPAGIRHILFGDRLCRVSFFLLKAHIKLLLLSMPLCHIMRQTHGVQYSVFFSKLVAIMSTSSLILCRLKPPRSQTPRQLPCSA